MHSQPGIEFEIKKRLDRLRGVGKGTFVNNINNQGGPRSPDFGSLEPPPPPPNIEDLIENGPQFPPSPPPPPGGFGPPPTAHSGGFFDNL